MNELKPDVQVVVLRQQLRYGHLAEELRIPAKVIEVRTHVFMLKASQPLDEDGRTLKWFESRDRGRTWDYA